MPIFFVLFLFSQDKLVSFGNKPFREEQLATKEIQATGPALD
jgi:hypothetical protein